MTTTKMSKNQKKKQRKANRYRAFTHQAHAIIKQVKCSLPELNEDKKAYTTAEKQEAYKVFWEAVNKHLSLDEVKKAFRANKTTVKKYIPNFFEKHGTSEEHWEEIVKYLYGVKITRPKTSELELDQLALDEWKDRDRFTDEFLLDGLEKAGGNFWSKYKMRRIYFDTGLCFHLADLGDDVIAPVGMKAFYDINKAEFSVTGAEDDVATHILDAFAKLRKELREEFREVAGY